MTLDTSHLAVSEDDIVDAYRAARRPRCRTSTSPTTAGKGRDSHAPLGKGILPIEDFVRALDDPVLRSVALEIEPGPQVQDSNELEKLFGESLDLVRRNLPTRTP